VFILQPAVQFILEEIPESFKKHTLLPALVCATADLGQGAPKSALADIVDTQDQKIGTAKILNPKKGIKIGVNVPQRRPASTFTT